MKNSLQDLWGLEGIEPLKKSVSLDQATRKLLDIYVHIPIERVQLHIGITTASGEFQLTARSILAGPMGFLTKIIFDSAIEGAHFKFRAHIFGHDQSDVSITI